jgi:hypothetical protein
MKWHFQSSIWKQSQGHLSQSGKSLDQRELCISNGESSEDMSPRFIEHIEHRETLEGKSESYWRGRGWFSQNDEEHRYYYYDCHGK